jgi:hypothetical protein
MNDLSWMIYWADTFGKMSSAFGFAAFLGVVPVGAITIMRFAAAGSEEEIARTAKAWFPKVVLIWALCLSVAIFTPSSQTVYAMAASEIGEEVITSPTAGKAMKALDAWLDRQINENSAP